MRYRVHRLDIHLTKEPGLPAHRREGPLNVSGCILFMGRVVNPAES